MGQANQLVAGVGAAMLLVGQFLPMLSAPFGISISFMDLSWKAASIGANAAAMAEEGRGKAREEHVDRPDKAPNHAFGIVKVVLVIAIFYPVCIFVVIAVAFYQMCAGTSPGAFTVIGGIAFLATLLYGLALLALSTQEVFRVVLVFTSPGIGWAVILIGALALAGAGMIRSDARD